MLKSKKLSRVCAKNAAGSVSSYSENSQIIVCDVDAVYPRLEFDSKTSEHIVSKAGETLKIEAYYFGKPKPDIIWKKDGLTIKKSSRISLVNADVTTTVLIRDATRMDSGQYTINLKNFVGEFNHTITAKVLDCPGPPENIKVDKITANTAKLYWKAPADDGGAIVTHYILEKRETSRLAWTVVAEGVR